MQAKDDRDDRALDELMNAIPQYERYLELARLSEIPVDDDEPAQQKGHVPAPLMLTIRTD